MRNWFDYIWHQKFGRPYRLAKVVDEGAGAPVVLLHGLGRSGRVWHNVVDLLRPLNARVVAYDLLGFGESPKPNWPDYNVDDHARPVIASLSRQRFGQPIVLVGHSMGCLVAVRVARLRPDLVKHLVLYEMPLYEGLPEKRRYQLRIDFYLKLYKRIVAYKPSFDPENSKLVERLAQRVAGLEVTQESWLPFVRSLENTIMEQMADTDIPELEMAMDVIYGSFDMFVIRGEPRLFFGDKSDKITAHTIRARHEISLKASKFIVTRVQAALQVGNMMEALEKEEEIISD